MDLISRNNPLTGTSIVHNHCLWPVSNIFVNYLWKILDLFTNCSLTAITRHFVMDHYIALIIFIYRYAINKWPKNITSTKIHEQLTHIRWVLRTIQKLFINSIAWTVHALFLNNTKSFNWTKLGENFEVKNKTTSHHISLQITW